MDENDRDSRGTPQQWAAVLATRVGELDDAPFLPRDVMVRLSAVHRGLISDTFGLLRGIANGDITQGQPRIHDNGMKLLEAIEQQPHDDSWQSAVESLTSLLSQAAAAGLSSSGQALSSARSIVKSR